MCATPIPSRDAVAYTIHKARRILFPGYFTQSALAPSNFEYCLKEEMAALYKALARQIIFATQHDCMRFEQPCIQCNESSRRKGLQFIQALPHLRKVLATDVRAAIGDNVWITESVPADTKVYLKKPELIYSGNGRKRTDMEHKKMNVSLDAHRRTGVRF